MKTHPTIVMTENEFWEEWSGETVSREGRIEDITERETVTVPELSIEDINKQYIFKDELTKPQ